MLHAISLTVVMFVVWLLLSGYFEPLLIIFGVLSCLAVVAIAGRMDVVDREGHPIHLGWRILLYWPWLTWQVILANLDVVRRVLDPRLPISPCVVRLKPSQKSDLGRVIFANSITLTPGTVSIDVTRDHILVHALSTAAAEELEGGDMDRRVARVEGDAGT